MDLKIFVDDNNISERLFNQLYYIENSITVPITIERTIIPISYLSKNDNRYLYDFYRRFCLKDGLLVYGNNDVTDHIQLIKSISILETRLVFKRLSTFHHAILVLYDLVSDNFEEKSKLIQIAISSYFHAVRYFEAFFGNVNLSLQSLQATYESNSTINAPNKELFSIIKELRDCWDKIPIGFLPDAFQILNAISESIANMLGIVSNNSDKVLNKRIIYKK